MARTNPAIELDIEAYRFYEHDWESYDEVYEAFEWEVPDRFNMAAYVCDRWADAEPDRTAVHAVTADGGRPSTRTANSVGTRIASRTSSRVAASSAATGSA